MDDAELQKLGELFLREFHYITRTDRVLIKVMIKSRLQYFPEAADLEYMTFGCIADIERILSEQIQADPSGHFNSKERLRKLTEFKKDKAFVKKYTLEAVKSFCRKKRYYWGHGKNKPDIEKGDRHTERKPGRAARVHGTGDSNEVDTWIASMVTSNLSSDSLQSETLEDLNELFTNIGLNEKKIRCFWDRFDGMTFVEMAAADTNKTASPDQYRKRFKRLIAQLERHSEQFRAILMQNFR
ncbi:hypothetical protein [Moritella sp. F3]|uniref:hypothetical protein n=1 Tax=Moritella sp. F3 TaxID=2718882 RepID=UPI0018E12999|nr:hypothetical protein [Moritella sp. F3]GIC75627.1 hypothetical protein FMO001_03540 [Moritella sp. F1]GIC80772.1 hypothetical protein FMO003_10530 [Moritella sp. F3]